MTEGEFFIWFFIVWFTIKWTLYVSLPDRMRKKTMRKSTSSESQESGQMPASANMAMWQTMGDQKCVFYTLLCESLMWQRTTPDCVEQQCAFSLRAER